MSKNAICNTTPAIQRQASIVAEWNGTDLDSMMKEIAADEAECRKRAEKALYRAGKRFISASGVEALVNNAKKEFSEATGATLPWNLDLRSGGDFGGTGLNYGPGNLGRRGNWLLLEHADEVMSQWTRFAGWLRTAKSQPVLARMITKTQGNGQGAKATKFNLWDMQRRWNSPHRLDRMVRAVRKRGNAILSAYAGELSVSYKGIALGLLAERSVGKAAIVAVAVTLGVTAEYGKLNYRIARQSLVDYHLCKVADNSDGVQSRREEHPRLVKLGVAVYRIGTPRLTRRGNTVGVDWKWLVRSSQGRTFHGEWGDEREALRNALLSWERQDELSAKDADLVSFLNGGRGFCPLFFRGDSRDAGNCSTGTESWLRERGWAERKFVPSVWLVKHLDYSLVRNVVMAVYHRHVA